MRQAVRDLRAYVRTQSDDIAHMVFFFLMIRRPPRSTQGVSSAASDVYKRQDIYSSNSIDHKSISSREYFIYITSNKCSKQGHKSQQKNRNQHNNKQQQIITYQ
eukprot:TRINITY_DN11487_c0_g1_i5.p2 TRINITY_DN11487_c0_g1~~TRINITY_DN11487_c0_g1_i5.p2  ORF type:complete len:104 (+),score=8.16 TRINITY_DN11487_c0_g1_i5:39-350(+)